MHTADLQVPCRYKPDNVLISEALTNASRFAALAARKLTRDGRHQSGGGIDMHALLQVTADYLLVKSVLRWARVQSS